MKNNGNAGRDKEGKVHWPSIGTEKKKLGTEKKKIRRERSSTMEGGRDTERRDKVLMEKR